MIGGEVVTIVIAVVFVILVVVGITHHLLNARDCPRCEMSQSLVKTGKRKGKGPWGILAGTQEWKCKHCGHLLWKDEPTGEG